MRPVLFSVLGLDVQTYGVSKALAAIVGGWLLGRAFTRLGLKADHAYSLAMWATISGFVAAKAYFLLEQLPTITAHDLGGSGFTWYGGLIGGVGAALWIIRRNHLPLAPVAGAAPAPLSVAYAIGRIGCFLSGDGTYGTPTDLPWGVTFTHGAVPTTTAVHPTPVYEALAALAIAAILWALARRAAPGAVFGSYLVLSGVARFGIEYLRINDPVVAGLTQPQLWALAGIGVGAVLIVRCARTTTTAMPATAPPVDEHLAGEPPAAVPAQTP